MEPLLIIIRGNSGSGKTVLAKKIQANLGTENCLLLQQDVLRRGLLHAPDQVGTRAIPMINVLGLFGHDHYPITILEGILRRDVYGPVLRELIEQVYNKALVYYIDLPFATTVSYDQQKKESFGTESLRAWWQEADYLTENDYILKDGHTEHFFQQVMADIEHIMKAIGNVDYER
ncbi:zeta toxin family protein [Pediococcus pentosaceus]|uniref:zeta toxin family protein n=1 Tax=Pediococcus pentosaceus TaxID=1255 RepID=UPI0039823921